MKMKNLKTIDKVLADLETHVRGDSTLWRQLAEIM